MKIEKNITIEELIETVPKSVRYLMDKGIKCIACGEPIWGTLEDAAKEKGFSNAEIDQIVSELQDLSNVDSHTSTSLPDGSQAQCDNELNRSC